MEQNRCYGCMKLKTQRPLCEHCGYSEAANNLTHQLPVGTVLNGQYVVGRVLGQGGFGITYLGWDNNLGRPVAIKEYFPQSLVNREVSHSTVINISSSGDSFSEGRDKFLREAQTLARLQNVPEIARVHNFFSANNTAYIIMEYVDGITLQHYVRQKGGRLSPEETLAILRPVIRAIAKVHKAGLVHRDISPDNIMLERGGQVRILDFGTARPNSNEVNGQATHSTQAVLKYGFAPIEQYQSRGNLGPWTDEYALCATAYYCMTGRIPPEASARVLGEADYQWRQIPGLRPHQAAALEQGTAMMISARFPDLDALEAALYTPAEAAAPQPAAPVQPAAPSSPVDTAAQLAQTQPLRQFTPPPAPTAPAQMPYTAPMETPGPVHAPYTAPMDTPAAPQVPYTAPLEKPKPGPAPVQKKLPRWLLPVAAGLALVVMLAILLMPRNDQPRYYQMKNGTISVASRQEITAIAFLSTLEDAPSTAWDVSAAGDGTVMAWVKYNKLYIAANGYIYAPESCMNLFHSFTSVTSIDFGGIFDTSNVTDMSGMFQRCSSLKSLDLSGFDTSNVTGMGWMFSGCSSLNFLDLSSFDTSNVTNMGTMFWNCSNLTTLNLSGFNTFNVTGMGAMFYDCSGLTSLDLSGFDTSKVTDMNNMFGYCSKLTSLDLSGFDTSNVTGMSGMFDGCSGLTSLDLSGFDTSNVTGMSGMFDGCSGLTSLDVSGFDTSKVTRMGGMFYKCSSLTSLDLSNFDTSNVTAMFDMFYECSSLTSLDLSGFDISNVTDMDGMFARCDKLTANNLNAPEELKEALLDSK